MAKVYVSWGSRIVSGLATVTVVTYRPEFWAGVSALCKCLSEHTLQGGGDGSRNLGIMTFFKETRDSNPQAD